MADRDYIPFLLHEAVLQLYPADANGEPVLASVIWWALTNNLSQEDKFPGPVIAASGALYATQHVLTVNTELTLDRSWILRAASLAEFRPQPAQAYVLEAVWYADGHWYRRMFYGCTPQTMKWNSRGTLSFIHGDTWRAERWADSGGVGHPSVYTPITPAPAGVSVPVGWFRESPCVPGEYLLGYYRWASAVTITGLHVAGLASSAGATVFALEIGGVVSATTITLPAGTDGAAVSADATVSVSVGSGVPVRWVIQSGPDVTVAAYNIALMADVLVP